ncbi:Hypothetical_protein [Hexamita inflata]|uniref:Hypothetical_protein n=1 Tax=Hexamita inflata TaxID=28002 RepID=A0AA86N5T0_9EUKA|nr:Hypothetical protein HINF_LOCUS956 [Hexamita inflata]
MTILNSLPRCIPSYLALTTKQNNSLNLTPHLLSTQIIIYHFQILNQIIISFLINLSHSLKIQINPSTDQNSQFATTPFKFVTTGNQQRSNSWTSFTILTQVTRSRFLQYRTARM